MFYHRKIQNTVAHREWIKLKKTVSCSDAYKAAERVGKCAAEDMLEFVDILRKSDIKRIYVKYRDGLPMASGMREILSEVDVVYVITERSGPYNNEVKISPFDGKIIRKYRENDVTWFADPINARGTTTIEVLRYLRNYIPFKMALLSHIAANRVGIDRVQTLITDFHVDSYMNYAFLSEKINQKTGYLQDGLEEIPDFGDKTFGTIGADYPLHQMQLDLKNLLGTKAGEVELLKGIIVFLLQRRESDEYKADREVKWSTRRWIKQTILWYILLRDIQITSNFDQYFDFIMDDLEKRGFINHRKYPYNDSYARVYFVTEDGARISSAVYIPVLAELGICNIILKDLDDLVHFSARDIRDSYMRVL